MSSKPHLYLRRIVRQNFSVLGVQYFEADPDIFSFEKTLE